MARHSDHDSRSVSTPVPGVNARLLTAIRLTVELLEALPTSDRAETAALVQQFCSALRDAHIRDRRLLAALLTLVNERVEHAAGQQPDGGFDDHDSVESMLSAFERRALLHDAATGTSGRAARVRRVTAFIDRHYAEAVTLDGLAALVGCHRVSLATEFRRETGITVHEYLTRVRIRHAADLLRNGDKIEPISLLVGYRGKKNFYRQFKEIHGMTPGQFKLLEHRSS
jgi:AraC-like DNA-binding protein